ncbi:hypothetical protein V5O48_011378 [Marasmius crinis-equi]|uniref:Uncharacterized protein n=1 Tax=Marasmius crinis-equi TaxID=585013 RepID=A0ABR3F5R2_9AGAR
MSMESNKEVGSSTSPPHLDNVNDQSQMLHETPDASTRTLVVERRRRLLVAHPNPRCPSTSSSSTSNPESESSGMSLSVVSVKDVRVLKISQPHSCHRCGDHPAGSHASAERTAIQRNNVRTGFQVKGRGRYINNSPNQRNYHYLPNGPARRSRYNVPGAGQHEDLKGPAVPSHTSFTLHRSPSSSSSSSSSRATSTESPYTSASEEWSPPASVPPHLRSACSQNPYSEPIPAKPSIRISTDTDTITSMSTPQIAYQKPQTASSYSRFDCHFSDVDSDSGDSDTRSEVDVKEEPMEVDLHDIPLATSKAAATSLMGSPISPSSSLSPESPTLGSRERELRELREFWTTLLPTARAG